jgi:cytochrome c nitrite reductase small subunit
MPPVKWHAPAIILMGVLSGLGLYTVVVSNALSYMVDSPETCVNCHIMAPHYATWSRSSHRMETTCGDCHVPQDNIFRHYFHKAKDGSRHAAIFTLRRDPNVITMHSAGRMVVQENCIRCHDFTNETVSSYHVTEHMARMGDGKLCYDCHRDVPHGTVRSTASTPFARVPLPQSPVPKWLQDMLKP